MTSSFSGLKQPPFIGLLGWLISACLAHAPVVGWWIGQE